MGEVDPKALLCNRCWGPLLATAKRAYKTSCDHLFCRKCAEKDFSRKLQCTLCDADLSDDGGITELDCSKAPDLARAAYALALTQPEEVLRVMYEAFKLARAQTALYGTREIWARGCENESVKRKLVEAENALNSVGLELATKAREVAELQQSLGARNEALVESERKHAILKKQWSDLRASGGGGGGGGGGNVAQQQQQQQQQRGVSGGGGGAHNPTPGRRSSVAGSESGPPGFPVNGGFTAGGGGALGHHPHHHVQQQQQQRPSSGGHSSSGSGMHAGLGLSMGGGMAASGARAYAAAGQPSGASSTSSFLYGGGMAMPGTPLIVSSSSGGGGGGGVAGGAAAAGSGAVGYITKPGGARVALGGGGSGLETLQHRGRSPSPLAHPGGLAAMRAQMPARLHTAAALDGASVGRYAPAQGGHLNLYIQGTPSAAGRGGAQSGGGF